MATSPPVTSPTMQSTNPHHEHNMVRLIKRRSLAATSLQPTTAPLPKDFVPSEKDVMCGKGKVCLQHPGNKRFRRIVQERIAAYSEAETKEAKGILVTKIVREVEFESADATEPPKGNPRKNVFCRFDNKLKQWFEVTKHMAREKVGQTIRDLLHTQYRSSTKSKKGRRKAQRMIRREEKLSKEQAFQLRLDEIMSFRMERLAMEFDLFTESDLILEKAFTDANMDILQALHKFDSTPEAEIPVLHTQLRAQMIAGRKGLTGTMIRLSVSQSVASKIVKNKLAEIEMSKEENVANDDDDDGSKDDRVEEQTQAITTATTGPVITQRFGNEVDRRKCHHTKSSTKEKSNDKLSPQNKEEDASTTHAHSTNGASSASTRSQQEQRYAQNYAHGFRNDIAMRTMGSYGVPLQGSYYAVNPSFTWRTQHGGPPHLPTGRNHEKVRNRMARHCDNRSSTKTKVPRVEEGIVEYEQINNRKEEQAIFSKQHADDDSLTQIIDKAKQLLNKARKEEEQRQIQDKNEQEPSDRNDYTASRKTSQANPQRCNEEEQKIQDKTVAPTAVDETGRDLKSSPPLSKRSILAGTVGKQQFPKNRDVARPRPPHHAGHPPTYPRWASASHVLPRSYPPMTSPQGGPKRPFAGHLPSTVPPFSAAQTYAYPNPPNSFMSSHYPPSGTNLGFFPPGTATAMAWARTRRPQANTLHRHMPTRSPTQQRKAIQRHSRSSMNDDQEQKVEELSSELAYDKSSLPQPARAENKDKGNSREETEKPVDIETSTKLSPARKQQNESMEQKIEGPKTENVEAMVATRKSGRDVETTLENRKGSQEKESLEVLPKHQLISVTAGIRGANQNGASRSGEAGKSKLKLCKEKKEIQPTAVRHERSNDTNSRSKQVKLLQTGKKSRTEALQETKEIDRQTTGPIESQSWSERGEARMLMPPPPHRPIESKKKTEIPFIAAEEKEAASALLGLFTTIRVATPVPNKRKKGEAGRRLPPRKRFRSIPIEAELSH